MIINPENDSPKYSHWEIENRYYCYHDPFIHTDYFLSSSSLSLGEVVVLVGPFKA